MRRRCESVANVAIHGGLTLSVAAPSIFGGRHVRLGTPPAQACALPVQHAQMGATVEPTRRGLPAVQIVRERSLWRRAVRTHHDELPDGMISIRPNFRSLARCLILPPNAVSATQLANVTLSSPIRMIRPLWPQSRPLAASHAVNGRYRITLFGWSVWTSLRRKWPRAQR